MLIMFDGHRTGNELVALSSSSAEGKRHLASLLNGGAKAKQPELAEALLGLKSVQEVRAFLVDLCTPAELEALADRWRVVPLLLQAMPYREIHDRTGISVTTVGRVARCLMQGEGGYRAAARHLVLSDD